MGKIVNDKWFQYLVILSAYFFMIVILLSVNDRNLSVAAPLFLLCILLLVIRIAYLAASKSKKAEITQADDNPNSIIRIAAAQVGYLALLAIIIEGKSDMQWLLLCTNFYYGEYWCGRIYICQTQEVAR